MYEVSIVVVVGASIDNDSFLKYAVGFSRLMCKAKRRTDPSRNVAADNQSPFNGPDAADSQPL